MSSLRLQGTEIGRFSQLLRAAFTRPRFAELLLYRLNRSMGDYASPADADPAAFMSVLIEANAQLWWRDLLRAARNALPTDPNLQAFEEEFGQSCQVVAVDKQGGQKVVGRTSLQLQIKTAQSTFDILLWRRKLGEIESRVCRLEYPAKTAFATGFLIGPDLVMTNYHAIEPFLDVSAAVRKDIIVRFDYKVLDDGLTLNHGKEYRLAEEWLVEKAPYSKFDEEIAPAAEPKACELDFAVLRLDGSPGSDPVGGDTLDPGAVPRGYIAIKPVVHDFLVNRAIYIVQHPDGKPMQIALDADAVVGMTTNGTRVRYTTTTHKGSSGSPCFSADWQLVALHHGGDPKDLVGLKPEFNQGIPINAIWDWVKEQGRESLFAG